MNRTEAFEAVDIMRRVFADVCPDANTIRMFNGLAEQVKEVLRYKQSPDDIKMAPQRCEEHFREHPDLVDAMVKISFGKLHRGEYMSGKGIIADLRSDPNIPTYGLRGAWEAYIPRWLTHHHPNVDWGFRFSSVNFICPWEDGYDEWMASEETDVKRWKGSDRDGEEVG